MGKIVVSENVSLDGVVEDPSGEQGFRHGGWFVQFIGQDWEAWAEVELAEAHGSRPLVRTLMEHDLVDELRLTVFRLRSARASVCSVRPATRDPCA